MFEFQTAISELTGCRSPTPRCTKGRRRSPRRLPGARRRQGGAGAWSSRAASIRTPARRSVTYSRGYGAEVVEVGLADGRTDADELAAALDERTAALFVANPNFLGAIEDLATLADGRPRRRRPLRRLGRPDHARCPAPARRVRGRRLRRRGPAARQPPGLRRPLVRLLRRHRGAPAPDAGPDRRRDHRRRRAARLRARAADARAAHPAREGDPQHLHQPGAERARRTIYLAWLGRAGIVELGELLVQRTAYARERLAARRRGRALARGAGGARVRRPPRRAGGRGCSTRRPRRGSPRYPLAREYPEYQTAC